MPGIDVRMMTYGERVPSQVRTLGHHGMTEVMVPVEIKALMVVMITDN